MKSKTMTAMILTLAVMASGVNTMSWGQAAPAAPAATISSQEVVIKSKVDAVTVYRGQALVTRTVDLPAGAGLGEFVVSELPDKVVAGSIFAEGGDGVEVRSVRYRERPVAQDIREAVRKLDDQLQALSDKLAANAKQQQVLAEKRAYLDKLANFAAPTATTEMTKGVLNADQLKQLTTFQFDTRAAIAQDELKLAQEQRTLQDEGTLLTRDRGEVTGRSSRTLREAVVFINRERPGGALRVRYLVDAASWSPSYNIRADADKKTATLEYQASIMQMSGEDWSDVSMTLSTASPSLVAAAPALIPLSIALSAGAPGGGRGGGGGAFGGGVAYGGVEYSEVQKSFSVQRAQAENIRATNNGTNMLDVAGELARDEQRKNDITLNRVADQLQVLELLSKDSRKPEERKSADASEGVVVTYQMRSHTSLPSRADRQLVQIDQVPVKGTFYKVAVPVLTSYVYDEAELTNTSPMVLLAGPVASYVGGQYVGSGAMDTVAVGQPFTVGFGIDSSLRATRELVEKTEQTQGGNRIVNYTYRIAVENFGSKPADVRLMDRLPTGKESEVRVAFDDAENVKVSADKDYQLTERKKGILRWDVEVPAQKNRSEAFALTYNLHLEHDKSLAISTAGLLGPELNGLLNH